MATIDVTVTDLTFPIDLGDQFCKFRPLISIRYRDSKDKIVFAREALPGLGKRDYWECEKGNKKKPEYVRNEAEHKVDMDKLDVSRREIIFGDLDVKKLERVEVEIFDIDIKSGFFDTLRDGVLKFGPMGVKLLVPATEPLSLRLIKGTVEEVTGKKVSDLEKGLIDKAMGKEDGVARSLWLHSQTLTNESKQTLNIRGAGVHGEYSVGLNIEVS
jgi:hypothetical protein